MPPRLGSVPTDSPMYAEAMRAALTAAVAIACTLATVPAAAQAFHYTHRVSVEGQITDHWSTTNPGSCAANGDGTITASFHTVSTSRVRPFVTRFSDTIRTNTPGRWVLGVPAGGGAGDMGHRPVTGTVVTTDNTVLNPNVYNPSDPCSPDDKSGCGTAALKHSTVAVTGYDKRSVWVDLIAGQGGALNRTRQDPSATAFCRSGSLESWQEPPKVVGGVAIYGDMVLKMPSRKKLAHTHTVKVAGTVHHVTSSSPSSGSAEVITDDVTRTVTVTFAKL